MTIVGSLKYKNKNIVYGDSKVLPGYPDAKPLTKMFHYENMVVAVTGTLTYAQLWNLFIDSGEYVVQDSLVKKLIQDKISKKEYKWTKEIIFALFLSFFDWVRKRELGFKDGNDVLGSIYFLVTTEEQIFTISWGSIEEMNTSINIGSGGEIATAIIETVNYLYPKVNEKEKALLFFDSLLHICPKLDKGVGGPFYITAPRPSKKGKFYILQDKKEHIVKVENKKEIEEYLNSTEETRKKR